MTENTKIEWADHTFNPWIGCTAVSPACDHCYAERFAKRFGVAWGPHAERKRTAPSTWNQPLSWNLRAACEGRRERVFCASLADVFDNQVPEPWRQDLWRLILATPHLDWLLLTKRPQNIATMLFHHLRPEGQPWPVPNVWLGTTVENQQEAERRIPHLLAAPAVKRFLSCEPLLGPVDLTRIARPVNGPQPNPCGRYPARIDWVICGGESGPAARAMHPDWARNLRDQCAAASVPFFFKQWGEWREAASGDQFNTALGRAQRTPAFILSRDGTVHCLLSDALVEPRAVLRVGKKAAGRLLDGIEHSEVPA